MKKQVVVPFDSGNATIIPGDGEKFKIIIKSKGIKYEFNASPVGIESFSVDGGHVQEYMKKGD